MELNIKDESFKRQCEFVKKHTNIKTNTSVVREAMRKYYFVTREEVLRDAKNTIQELEGWAI